MITLISDFLFFLCFIAFSAIFAIFYRYVKTKNIGLKGIAIILFGIVYLTFYFYQSMPEENIQQNSIAVSKVEGLSETDIINKILTQELEYYKSKRIFNKNKIFDYRINRINGPIKNTGDPHKNYYDISYSVKTIDPTWFAGNGTSKGLWINNKSGFYILLKDGDRYILKYIGGL